MIGTLVTYTSTTISLEDKRNTFDGTETLSSVKASFFHGVRKPHRWHCIWEDSSPSQGFGGICKVSGVGCAFLIFLSSRSSAS